MPQGYLAVAAAAALWGISGTLAKFMFRLSVDPALLINFRMTFSFLLLAGAMLACRRDLLRVPAGMWSRIAVWSLFGMVPVQFFYMYAIQQTTVATAIFLQYLAPVVTALYATAVERKPPGATLVGALVIAVGGSALLVFGAGAGLKLAPLGLAAGLAACFFFSFYTIYGGRAVGRVNSWTLLVWALGMGALFWNVILPPWVTIPRVQDPLLWGFFAYIAVFATIVPFGLFLWGLRHVAPTPAALTAMMEPVVGTAVAWLALGEHLKLPQVAGGVLILAAVAAVQWHARRQTGAVAKGA